MKLLRCGTEDLLSERPIRTGYFARLLILEDCLVASLRFRHTRRARGCLLADVRPQVVIHLAARVGGIGANRDYPAEFFYDNLLMGVQLLHESWRAEVEKFVAIGTVCYESSDRFDRP